MTVLLLLLTGYASIAAAPDKPDTLDRSDLQSFQFISYNNKDAYEAGTSHYSISFYYVKGKGYNACTSFEAPAGLSKEDLEALYVNALYPDATLWLWDYGKELWIPVPLELSITLDEVEHPVSVAFTANWKENQQLDRVTGVELNLAIADALSSNLNTNGNDWSDSWLELAIGHYVEFNILYPAK